MAAIAETSVEFLVTGEEPLMVQHSEIALIQAARKWKSLISDLESLSPGVAEGFKTAIHATAEECRQVVTRTGTEN